MSSGPGLAQGAEGERPGTTAPSLPGPGTRTAPGQGLGLGPRTEREERAALLPPLWGWDVVEPGRKESRSAQQRLGGRVKRLGRGRVLRSGGGEGHWCRGGSGRLEKHRQP